MTFVKPSTVSTGAGAYQYKGAVSSPSSNYIDNSFPNILDAVGGGTISGTVDVVGPMIFENSGSLIIATGCSGTFLAGSTLVTATGSSAIFGGTNSFYGNANYEGITDFYNTVNFETGINVNTATGCTVDYTGATINLIGAGLGLDSNSTLSVNGSFVVETSNIKFGSAVVDPTISQDNAGFSAGTDLTIASQHSTAGNAGNMYLLGGNSTVANGGNVNLTGGSSSSGMGGYVSLNGAVNPYLLTVNAAGLQLGPTTFTNTSGTHSLSLAQYSNPWILIRPTGGNLTGNLTIVFPSGTGPAIWFVSAGSVTFSSYSISFKCGTETANTTLTAAGSNAAIVMVDDEENIFASGAI